MRPRINRRLPIDFDELIRLEGVRRGCEVSEFSEEQGILRISKYFHSYRILSSFQRSIEIEALTVRCPIESNDRVKGILSTIEIERSR